MYFPENVFQQPNTSYIPNYLGTRFTPSKLKPLRLDFYVLSRLFSTWHPPRTWASKIWVPSWPLEPQFCILKVTWVNHVELTCILTLRDFGPVWSPSLSNIFLFLNTLVVGPVLKSLFGERVWTSKVWVVLKRCLSKCFTWFEFCSSLFERVFYCTLGPRI